jgi:hypothetical protein
MSYQGPVGPTGPTGLQGTQGQQGLQGPGFGPQGAGYFSTSYGLSTTVPNNTDFYIDIKLTSGSYLVTGRFHSPTNATVLISTSVFYASDKGIFFVISVNSESGSGVRFASSAGAYFVYNGTINAQYGYQPVTTSAGAGLLLIYDGTNFVVM